MLYRQNKLFVQALYDDANVTNRSANSTEKLHFLAFRTGVARNLQPIHFELTLRDSNEVKVLTQAPHQEGLWVEVQLHTFLTSTLDEGGWSASCPGHFTDVKNPRQPSDGPRGDEDVVVKISAPTGYRTLISRSYSP